MWIFLFYLCTHLSPRSFHFCTSSTGTLYSLCRSIVIIVVFTITNPSSKITEALIGALVIAAGVAIILVLLGLALFFGVMPEGKAESFYGNNDIREYYKEQWNMPDTISDDQELVLYGCTIEKSDIWRCKWITLRNRYYMPKDKVCAFLLRSFPSWAPRSQFFVPRNTKFIMHAKKYVGDRYPLQFIRISNGQADADENHNRNRGFNAVAPVGEARARPSAVDEEKGDIVDNFQGVLQELREEMETSRRSGLRQRMQRRASQDLLTFLASESGLKAPNELGNGHQGYNDLGDYTSKRVSSGIQKGGVDFGEIEAMIENVAGVNYRGVAERPRDLQVLLLLTRVLAKGEYI